MATNGPSRRRLPAGDTREVLAQNLNRMMESRYKDASNRPLALARDAGVSLSTVQRTLGRASGTTIDTIEAFSKVFAIQVYQMLVPWGLLGELAVRAAQPEVAATNRRRRPLFRSQAKSGRGDKPIALRRQRSG